MYTLLADPAYPVFRTPLATVLRSPTGGSAFQLRALTKVPYYEFKLIFPFESEDQYWAIADFLVHHMGATAFWFDGNVWGDINKYQLLGFGNGSDKDFYLKNRNVFANSVVPRVNRAINTAWTMAEPTGLLSFTTAPAAGAVIDAIWQCKYKVVFWYEGERMPDQSLIFHLLYNGGEITLREIP